MKTKQKNNFVGVCNFGSNLIASDPCYSRGTHCAAFDIQIKPGSYNCYALTQNEGRWGERVAEIKILHKDSVNSGIASEILSKYVIGVDSGQAGFFDDSVYPHLPEGADKHKHPEFNYNNEKGFYKQACNLTNKEQFGIGFGGKGFVSRSGFGDGGYSLWLYKENNEIVGAKIVFINEEDFED
jgi:hypothetical protein